MLYADPSILAPETAANKYQLAPAQFLIGMSNNQIAGEHCLEHTHPEFRQRVKDGFNIVVAGKAFGCGSSREQAVMALLGTPIPPSHSQFRANKSII